MKTYYLWICSISRLLDGLVSSCLSWWAHKECCYATGHIADMAYILDQRLEACSTQKTWYPLQNVQRGVREVLQALEIALSSCALRAQLYILNSSPAQTYVYVCKESCPQARGTLSVLRMTYDSGAAISWMNEGRGRYGVLVPLQRHLQVVLLRSKLEFLETHQVNSLSANRRARLSSITACTLAA